MTTPPEPARRLGDGYRVATATLAGACADAVGGWWDRTDGGAPFPIVAGVTVAVANRRAVTLAARYLADSLTVTLAEPVLAPDLDPDFYADEALIRRALTDVDRPQALTVARDEPLSAGRAALRYAQQRQPRIVAAMRVGGNCRICAPKNGTRVPAGADVRSHPGCDCTTIPLAA